jgi:4-carboxymuconolactone decarboxylase
LGCDLVEIVYQAVPYVGMAKAFGFVHAANEVMFGWGIQLPLAGQSTTSPETYYGKGLAIQKTIFGETIDRMYDRLKTNCTFKRFCLPIALAMITPAVV